MLVEFVEIGVDFIDGFGKDNVGGTFENEFPVGRVWADDVGPPVLWPPDTIC